MEETQYRVCWVFKGGDTEKPELIQWDRCGDHAKNWYSSLDDVLCVEKRWIERRTVTYGEAQVVGIEEVR